MHVGLARSRSYSLALTILDVGPLLLLPLAIHVLKLVLDVRLPRNVIVCNRDVSNLQAGICSPQLERIIEVALSDEAAWEGCRILIKQSLIVVGELYPATEVLVLCDGLTVAQLVDG